MTTILLQTPCWIQSWKDFKNRPTFGKVVNKECRWFFLAHSVYGYGLHWIRRTCFERFANLLTDFLPSSLQLINDSLSAGSPQVRHKFIQRNVALSTSLRLLSACYAFRMIWKCVIISDFLFGIAELILFFVQRRLCRSLCFCENFS